MAIDAKKFIIFGDVKIILLLKKKIFKKKQ